MRNGQRVFDADTHEQPSAETLEPYFDRDLRERLPDLEPYKVPIKIGRAGEIRQPPYRHFIRFGRAEGWGSAKPRILGEAEPRDTDRHFQQFMGSRFPTENGGDDRADIRLADMDEEGVDVHMMVPGGAFGHKDPATEMALLRAAHRHLDDFCSASPHRLKSLIMVTARCVDESVQEIRRWGRSSWAVGIQPFLPLDYPLDHPDLNPLWQAADEEGLTVVHHSFAGGYPGYRDLWNNPFLGRTASHPWAAMRAVGSFLGSGIMDRYPNIKFAVLESGFGWLPFWARRMDDQVTYMGTVAEDLKRRPSEYMESGRFFCSIVLHEGEEMVKMVDELMGDQILMFGSDYPHAESRFPDSVDIVQGWSCLSQLQRDNLFWNNAVRCFGEP